MEDPIVFSARICIEFLMVVEGVLDTLFLEDL